MTDRKYILLPDQKFYMENGTVLHRIQAVRNFGMVKKGDLGGWIESEDNLSHDDFCWVMNEAMVIENGRVYGDALIRDNSIIYGNAKAHGCANLMDHTALFGTANVSGFACLTSYTRIFAGKIKHTNECIVVGPMGSRNDYTTFFRGGSNQILVTCGCFTGDVLKFKAQVLEKHANTQYAKAYLSAIKLAYSQLL